MFPVVFTDPSSSAPVTTTLALTDGSTPPVTGTSGQITVAPAPVPTPVAPTGFAILLPAVVPSGVPVMVSAVVVAETQPVLGSTYDGTPTLAISGGCSATLNGTPLPTTVQFTDGKANFSLVFTIASSVTPQNGSVVPMPVPTTLTLTDAKNDLSGSITFGVVPAGAPTPQPIPIPVPTAPTQLTLGLLSVPPGATVPAGVPVPVQATALANGQPAFGFSGPAALSIAGDTATMVNGATTVSLPASITFDNGVAQFLLVFDPPATVGTTDAVTLTLDDTTDNLTCTLQLTVEAPLATPPGLIV